MFQRTNGNHHNSCLYRIMSVIGHLFSGLQIVNIFQHNLYNHHITFILSSQISVIRVVTLVAETPPASLMIVKIISLVLVRIITKETVVSVSMPLFSSMFLQIITFQLNTIMTENLLQHIQFFPAKFIYYNVTYNIHKTFFHNCFHSFLLPVLIKQLF